MRHIGALQLTKMLRRTGGMTWPRADVPAWPVHVRDESNADCRNTRPTFSPLTKSVDFRNQTGMGTVKNLLRATNFYSFIHIGDRI
jgi:hypothetical protein